MTGWVSILGAVASLVGASVAIWQAIRARHSAAEAKVVQDQMVKYDRTLELGSIRSALRRAQQAMQKYGPASTSGTLRGVDHQRDATRVQEAVAVLREHADILGEDKDSVVVKCTRLDELVGQFGLFVTNLGGGGARKGARAVG